MNKTIIFLKLFHLAFIIVSSWFSWLFKYLIQSKNYYEVQQDIK